MCASLSRQGTAVPSPNRDATNICALSTLFPYNPLKRLLTLLSCLLRPPSSSERGLHYHYYHSYYSYDTVFVIRECFARASTLITHEHYTFLENRKKQGKQKKRSLGAKLLRIYIYTHAPSKIDTQRAKTSFDGILDATAVVCCFLFFIKCTSTWSYLIRLLTMCGEGVTAQRRPRN